MSSERGFTCDFNVFMELNRVLLPANQGYSSKTTGSVNDKLLLSDMMRFYQNCM